VGIDRNDHGKILPTLKVGNVSFGSIPYMGEFAMLLNIAIVFLN